MAQQPAVHLHYHADKISALLQIEPPFLLIDTIEVNVTAQHARACRQLHPDDWFFSCHLPQQQVMPATLITEGMLQTLVTLIYSCVEHGAHRSYITHLNVQLHRGAKPGDRLEYRAQLLSNRHGIIKGRVRALVGGRLIGQGQFQYASPHLMELPVRR